MSAPAIKPERVKNAHRVHRIKSRNGDLVQVGAYSPRKAIKAFCTECLGFETHPKDCTASSCPLYPFRGKVMI